MDHSINSPGITVITDAGAVPKFYNLNQVKKKSGSYQVGDSPLEITHFPMKSDTHSIEARIEYNTTWALGVIMSNWPQTVVFEEYAFSAKGNRILQQAEAIGVLKSKLFKCGIQVDTFPITQIKKGFSGKGNAGKEEMIDAFINQTGMRFDEVLNLKIYDKPIDDLCDSYAIASVYIKDGGIKNEKKKKKPKI